jgi:hypothetical protein
MADRTRYPTWDEFWERLRARDVEEDLQQALDERTRREERPVARVGVQATVETVAARILPGAVPAAALAVFLDERFDQQLGRADEKLGTMPRAELVPAGFAALDAAAATRGAGSFAELPAGEQERLLSEAEQGKLPGPERFDSAAWFMRVRGFLLLAYGSDPRGMVEMGFPGPSYKPGHTWLDEGETQARVQRKPGYLTL